MVRQIDCVTIDNRGFVRVGKNGTGVVLFRIIEDPTGKLVHIRLKSNCLQVEERGDPNFYVPWDDFKSVIES